jgi:hypothetical protein
MKKGQYSEWTSTISVEAYGRTIGVRSNDRGILARIKRYLPYGSRLVKTASIERMYSLSMAEPENQSRRRSTYALFAATDCLAESDQLSDILETLEQDARRFIAEHARRHVFIHAAVVGWFSGAIVIPGKSMSGKTTLATAFIRAGASYFSDEYAVFDEKGLVHPYAKPLSIRASKEHKQNDYPVETFGGRAATNSAPVALVLATEYREGSRWRPEMISPGMGMMQLLANAVGARNEPQATIDVLRQALNGAVVWKGIRGESAEVVEHLIRSRDTAELLSSGRKKASRIQ